MRSRTSKRQGPEKENDNTETYNLLRNPTKATIQERSTYPKRSGKSLQHLIVNNPPPKLLLVQAK